MREETWERCRGHIVYFGFKKIVEVEEHYQAKFKGASLSVFVKSPGKPVATFTGDDLGGGHYQLSELGGTGKVLMHRLPGSDSMLGCWDENGERGLLHLMNAPQTKDGDSDGCS